MRTTIAATATILSALQIVAGQTFTDCDPTKTTCPPEPALGTTLTTDFTAGAASEWEPYEGTTITYDATNGAAFTIARAGNAPTVGLHKYIMFGKIDVVMRASTGAGIVSSFVLESGDLDEIDWEWIGSDRGNVQTNFFGKGNTTTYDRGAFHPMSDPTSAFHKYTIDWTAETLKWYIDDVLVRTVAYGDALALGGKNYPQTPMQVKLGSWIGCASQAAADDPKTKWTCEWAGGPADLSAPQTMYVKSIKVEDYGCAQEYSYGDMSGSYQSIVQTGGCKGGKSEVVKPVSSSASSSAAGSKTTAAPPTSSSTSGAGLLIETNGSSNVTSSQVVLQTNTLSTATRSSAATGTAVGAASGTSAAPAQVSGNAGTSLEPKKKYGITDAAVVMLGLGVGYIFM